MTTTIKNTIERTRQYWYVDGFSELLVGAIFVVLGLLNGAALIVKPSIGSSVIVGIGYPLVILGGVIFGNKWVRSMKEKVTYPRTGYVKYIQPERPSRRERMIKAFVIAFMVSIVINVILSRLDPFWIVLGTGLIIAAFVVYMAAQIPLNRFYILAGWIAIVSFAAARLPVTEDMQICLLLAGAGLGWLVGGVISLVTYLRNNPLEAAENAGEL
jgi:hypothetical protein